MLIRFRFHSIFCSRSVHASHKRLECKLLGSEYINWFLFICVSQWCVCVCLDLYTLPLSRKLLSFDVIICVPVTYIYTSCGLLVFSGIGRV